MHIEEEELFTRVYFRFAWEQNHVWREFPSCVDGVLSIVQAFHFWVHFWV